jgi:RNA recognition motif-containing protein
MSFDPISTLWSSNPRPYSSLGSPVSQSPTFIPSLVPRLKVFVGGLSQSTSEDEMREYFVQFGSSGVADVEIKIDKLTGRSRGFGFVSILGCDTQRLFLTPHRLSGRPVDVAEVTENKIVVTSLKISTTIDIVVQHFSRYGQVTSCDHLGSSFPGSVMPYGAANNSVMVVFESAESATNALAENSHFVDGVRLDVRKAEPRRKGGMSGASTTVNTPVMTAVMMAGPPTSSMQQQGYGAYGGYGEFDLNHYSMHAESRILPKLEYGSLGTGSSYGVYPVPGYDMLPGVGTSNRYHPIAL